MDIQQIDPRPSDKQRMLEDAKDAADKKVRLMTNRQTPLSKSLSDFEESWLLEHVVSRWNSLHGNLSHWRGQLEHFEKLADDDYSDRAAANNPEKTSARRSIFEQENHTLGVLSGMTDAVKSRAESDLFSVRPWLAATPQGRDDTDLASRLPKHAQWKFNQANVEEVLSDALKLAVDLGTVFVKARWLRDIDTSERVEAVAWSKSAKKPLLSPASDYITDLKDLPEGINGDDIEWKEMLFDEVTPIYDNVEAACLDFKAVAFDRTAPCLDLRYTPFFHRFSMRVLDLVADYGLSDEQRDELLAVAHSEESEEARMHRGETEAEGDDATTLDPEANPTIHLVEGFIRCDPRRTGRPIRIHVIFSPSLHALFRCDYLANESPGAMLPIFPVRCFRKPRRILGAGYWERFENENDAIDRQYCATTFRNRHGADVWRAFKRSALAHQSEGEDLTNHPEKLYELAEDKTIDDLISFKVAPDNNDRSMNLMQAMAQFLQMRTGLTSAAQGEVKGLPSSNTATGVNAMMTLGALLVKNQIAQMGKDIRQAVEYMVHLIYANHDHDETFVWGEGQDAELLEIKANDVQGLRANVSLVLSQSEQMEKLDNARTAIEICQSYVAMPEPEKPAMRRLFIQALESLGFNDADRIIREAMVDVQGIRAMLPPDLLPAFDAFLQTQGMLAPADPATQGAAATDAPVIDAAEV